MLQFFVVFVVLLCCLLLSFSNDEIPAEALSRQSFLAAQYNQKVVLIVSEKCFNNRGRHLPAGHSSVPKGG